MKRKNLKLLSMVFAVVMLISVIDLPALASFGDTQGHWASAQIAKWSNLGILNGDGKNFRPDGPVTRGEIAAILNNLMQYQARSENTFSDLGDRWYTDAILAANASGIIVGSGNQVRPEDNATREEAAVMLSKALAVQGGGAARFTDNAKISEWALDAVNGMAAKGYINGLPNGSFNPKAKITRAEVVSIINNAIQGFYNKAGTYTEDISGTVVINTPGVILKNMTIKGDLILAEGLGMGDIILENVNVEGTTVVRGSNINLMIDEKTSVNQIEFGKGAANSTATIDGTAKVLVSDAEGLVVKGTGKLESAEIHADNNKIEIVGTKVTAAAGVTGTFAGTKEVAAGTSEVIIPVSTPTSPPALPPTPTPTAPTPTPPPVQTEAYITKGGIANADIIIGIEASPMEVYAANELRSTINMVSGAELPAFFGEVGGDLVPEPEQPEYTPNLIQNPGFEDAAQDGQKPLYWEELTFAELDNETVHSGQYSLKIRLNTGLGYTAIRTLPISGLKPGQEYLVQAWVKGNSTNAEGVIYMFDELDSGWNSVVNSGLVRKPVTNEWTLVEWKYIVSSETSSEFSLIRFFSVMDELWIDDVSLTEVNGEVQEPPVQDTEPPKEEEPQEDILNGERVELILVTPDSFPALAGIFADDILYMQDTDGFAVRKIENKIYIIGSEPKGVLNGVYDFLEKNAGVLWTRSTELGTLYDSQPTILAEHINYREKSPFELRGWHLCGDGVKGEAHTDDGTERMLTRNKLNAKFAEFMNLDYWNRHESHGLKAVNLGHSLEYWLPNDIYFEEHPDYYNTDAEGNYIPVSHATQINFYHPDVPKVIADRMKEFLVRNPVEYIGIGINDTHYFMQGELSKSPFVTEDGITIQPDEEDYKSTVYYTFVNKIARELKKTNPNVKLATFAYFFTEITPRVSLEDNIVIALAPINGDDRTPINIDDASNANYKVRVNLEKWLEKTNNIVMYNYYGSFLSDTYERPIAEKVQEDMKYYRDQGILGILPEGMVDSEPDIWGINALQFWLFNKLFWNPDADIEQLKNDFIQKAYGDAAEAMSQYYALIKQGWNYDQERIAYNTTASTYIGKYIIKAGIRDAAQHALDEAWEAADETVRKRIEPIKNTFERMTEEFGGLPELSARAERTAASKEEIVNSFNFNQGPWSNAKEVTDFRIMMTSTPATVQTKVRLLWDEENIYVSYENFDEDISKIVVSGVSGEWWTGGADDDVQTYITGDPEAESYYVFFSNANADKFEYSGPNVDASYSATWETYAQMMDDRWVVIQVIPFDSIGVDPNLTKTLKGYFFRTYHFPELGGEGCFGWGGGAPWSSADFNDIHLVEPRINYVVNPGFEEDAAETQTPTGWGTWSEGDWDADSAVAGEAKSGTYYGRHFKDANYYLDTSQVITNLENGTYELEAWVRSSGGQVAAEMHAKFFAENQNGISDRLVTNIPTTDVWTKIRIENINVTNNQCTISFWSNASAGQWIEFDDVMFSKME